MSDAYEHIVVNIIKQQESLIGPVAVERAKMVGGMTLDWPKKTVSFTGEPSSVIDSLVDQYKVLFGQISVEVCKEAVGSILNGLNSEEVPSSLR